MDEELFEIFDASLQLPFSMIISGPSTSGKSSLCINLLKNNNRLIEKDFDYILWFYGESKPRDKQLRADRRVKFIKGLPDDMDSYIHSELNGIIIFDDLMTEVGNSALISSFFTKKTHHQNVSVIFITQNYFSRGKERLTVTRNATYLILFNSPMDQTTAENVGRKIMPKNQNTFLKIYNHATSKAHGYLFIDGHQKTPPQARLRTDLLTEVQRVFIPL